MESGNPNTFAFEFAGKSIVGIYGSLDDFPEEVADAIASQYVLTVTLLRDMEAGRVPSNVSFEACVDRLAQLQATLNHLPEMIESLRTMKRDGRNDLFDYWCTFLLDDLKYGIKNAGSKPELWRLLERKFKKATDIRGIYKILKFGGFLN